MEGQHSEGNPLRSIAGAVRRHVFLIVAVTLVVTGLASVYALSRPAKYVSSASVLIRPLPGNALSADSIASSQQITVAMETEAGLVNSPAVTDIVSKTLGTTVNPGTIAVAATVPPNTEIVRIAYTARSAAGAQLGAQTFAESFLVYRQAQAQATQRYQLDRLRAQAATAAANLKKASTEAGAVIPPPDAAAQVQLETSLLASLQASIGQLQVQDFNAGTVVAPARLPTKPSGLSPLLLIVAGAVCGLALGVGLAVGLERKRDRVRGSSETFVAGVPILASIPVEKHPTLSLLDERDAGDPLHNAYRQARTVVLSTTQRPSAIVVSAVSHADPVGDVVANLGLSLASAGYRVTVADATLTPADPSALGRLLGVGNGPGLSDVLVSGRVADVPVTRVRGLVVVAAGTDPAGSRESYSGAGLAEVVSGLRSDADYVIVAAPPASSPDGNSVAVVGDALLLVMTDGSTTHHEVALAIDRAQQLGIRVLGAISVPRRSRSARAPERPADTAADTSPRATPEERSERDPQPLAKAAGRSQARRARHVDGASDVR